MVQPIPLNVLANLVLNRFTLLTGAFIVPILMSAENVLTAATYKQLAPIFLAPTRAAAMTAMKATAFCASR